jgi:hypothetical protein
LITHFDVNGRVIHVRDVIVFRDVVRHHIQFFGEIGIVEQLSDQDWLDEFGGQIYVSYSFDAVKKQHSELFPTPSTYSEGLRFFGHQLQVIGKL